MHCSCANALYPGKQINKTNATSHIFSQMSDLKIFPECFRGTHTYRGPVVGPHSLVTRQS